MDNLLSAIESFPNWVVTSLSLITLVVIALLADILTKRQLVRMVHRLSSRTNQIWDDALADQGVFARVAQVVPALIFYFGLPLIQGLPEKLVTLGQNVASAYAILLVSLALSALLSAVNAIYEQYPVSSERPIKGYLQVAKIVIFILTAVLVLAVLMERSPALLLSGIGAMTAILLLIFKDTILSLVASVQLTSLDMVRVGDWLEMPQANADGDVIDIDLHTVKVQNWDKTISTIPTHKLITESFKNWRGMDQSGGRRIKRYLAIDVSSIRFLSEKEAEKFKRFALIKDYIAKKQKEIVDHNATLNGVSEEVNFRRLTNMGTFRAYVYRYLKNHPSIHQNMTLLVRQLQPTPEGLPLEIYAFTNVTDWLVYENIQADIFDHLLSIAAEFDLNMYQNPSGRDLDKLHSP